MANIFRAKSLISRTGVFSNEVIAPNLVYNTGNQTISGIKTFAENTTFGDTGQGDFLVISGNNFTVYGSGNFTSGLFVSGSPVLTGSSTLYATTANLALTGSTLTNDIVSLSGLFTGFTGNLDTTFASDIQLANTGSTLDTKINTLSGSSVLLYGDQNISGNKTFVNNINVSGTGTFNAIDLNNIDNLSLSGIDISITGSTVNIYGNILISGNPVLTGVDLTPYATTSNLALTGSTLATNLASTGSTLATDLASTGSTLSTDLANTGSTLQTNINNLSGYINSTSSNIVFTTGNQSISGVKTFNNTITTRIISGLSGIGGADSISLNSIDNAYNIFSSNFAGGNVKINGGSGNFAGGSVSLNAGKAGNTSYGGRINVNGDIYINNTSISELASRTINIYKTGIAFGNPVAINALTIDNNNISLNTAVAGGAGF